MGNRQAVERYVRSMAENDLDAQVALMHEDYECRYPQSGEVIRGPANLRAMVENYPESTGQGLPHTVDRIVGTDDAWISRPSFPSWTLVHVTGSGDDFTVTGTITYPNGQTWHAVALLTLVNGRIWRETDYFASPFEAPGWRAPYVERDAPVAR